MFENKIIHKPKFYGRRKGKSINSLRKKILIESQKEYGISIEASKTDNKHINPKDLFSSNYEEFWLEIGFGGGEHLIEMAQKFPQNGFIGSEPFINGVANMTRQIHAQEIKNIRFFSDDMRLLLSHIPAESFDKIFVLFPDPWPKKRHHKRRIISSENLALFDKVLKKGGELQIATDHDDYFIWIEKNLKAYNKFQINESVTWSNKLERASWWIPTRYEEKALEKGISCTALRCLKK